MLELIPCRDSPQMAADRKRELWMDRGVAAQLGRSAVRAIEEGGYVSASDRRVDWSELVDIARRSKVSIAPDAPLPTAPAPRFEKTRVQVRNATTLMATKEFVDAGRRPLALNFANGTHVGGGFLNGARAQEENLCRSSALYVTLNDDPMYGYHDSHDGAACSDWVILSPDVPVFRTDSGEALEEPYVASFLTAAAPIAKYVGQPKSGDLLQKRIHRVLDVARAYEYNTLVLGAWGCGAFGNDVRRTAADFRAALEGEFSGVFDEVVFAITDWSEERDYLGPFAEVFAS